MKKDIQKIKPKSMLLGDQLVSLLKNILRQLILPSRNKKGNLLSSVLLLFTELVILLVQFPWDFSIDFIKRWKHYKHFYTLLRKGIIITGLFLFLLSSFEWSYARDSKEAASISCLEQQTCVYASSEKVADNRASRPRLSYYPLAENKSAFNYASYNHCSPAISIYYATVTSVSDTRLNADELNLIINI